MPRNAHVSAKTGTILPNTSCNHLARFDVGRAVPGSIATPAFPNVVANGIPLVAIMTRQRRRTV